MIGDMIISKTPKERQMAAAAQCYERTIQRMKRNIRIYGETKAPSNGVGRRRKITPRMLDVLCEYLLTKPDLYQYEMADFLYDGIGITVETYDVSRALKSAKWSKKVARRVAKERNPDLRDYHLHTRSDFKSWQLVYVDESGCNQHIGIRRTGWSPLGKRPVQVTGLHRDRRYQILPAYTQDGVLFYRVYHETTDSIVFEDYIEQLLHHCNPFPKPRSVLVMDNASFHHIERIKELCRDAGVILVYLPPYSPDLNPIEEFFAELKAFIKKQWHEYESSPHRDFQVFLEWCVGVVGGRERSARGRFRHAGVNVEEY
jgi:transposase